jgi:hypothetical protein
MEDTKHHPDDLRDLCRVNPWYPWLVRLRTLPKRGGGHFITISQFSDAIIFDAAAARKAVTDNADKISQIRRFREEHEEAEKLKLASTKIMDFISSSLAEPAMEGKIPWTFNYRSHMPDVMSLPAIKPVLDSIQKGADVSNTTELWSLNWSQFCDQMVEMEDECE